MWIARDRDNTLWLFDGNKPWRTDVMWDGDSRMILDCKEYPELKWEDEPMEVELTPVKHDNGIDGVDEYLDYLETLNDDFAMELRSDALYYISKKIRGGEWKRFDDENLEEIKRFLLECIYDDYDMMKTYFPKELKNKSGMKILDQWFNFKKYKLDDLEMQE